MGQRVCKNDSQRGHGRAPIPDLLRRRPPRGRPEMTRGLAVLAVTAAMLFLAAPGANASATDATPPSADWVSPADGATIAARSVTLQANATDAGGSDLERVSFSAFWTGAWHLVSDVSVTGSSATA